MRKYFPTVCDFYQTAWRQIQVLILNATKLLALKAYLFHSDFKAK